MVSFLLAQDSRSLGNFKGLSKVLTSESGKHDVGSLAKDSRHASQARRYSQSHTHNQ